MKLDDVLGDLEDEQSEIDLEECEKLDDFNVLDDVKELDDLDLDLEHYHEEEEFRDALDLEDILKYDEEYGDDDSLYREMMLEEYHKKEIVEERSPQAAPPLNRATARTRVGKLEETSTLPRGTVKSRVAIDGTQSISRAAIERIIGTDEESQVKTEQEGSGFAATSTKKKEKKKKNPYILPAFAGAIAALALFGCGFLVHTIIQEAKEQEAALTLDVELEIPERGEFISYQGYEIPVHEDVPKYNYDNRWFYPDENGYMHYEMDGGGRAIPGIDVSHHQLMIDWSQVADAGFEFAMIRVARRGYGEEGNLGPDDLYRQNIEGALANGLHVGVYFFSQATSLWEVVDEVKLLLELIEEYDISYPVVFDWEFITTEPARTDHVTGAEITEMALYFCEKVEAAGYTPAIYFNLDMAYRYLDLSTLKEYPFWLAQLTDKPHFYYHFDIWQYTFTGKVPGIDMDVDLNLSFRDFAAEKAARDARNAQLN